MSAYSFLKLGVKYTRKDLGKILNIQRLGKTREGVVTANEINSVLLFVDLDKEGKEKRFHFNDFFLEDSFHWDSQTTQTINSPLVKRMISGEIETNLFVRIYSKLKGETQPFVYCGRLSYLGHDQTTIKPVHIEFESLDYDESTSISDLKSIYNWKSSVGSKYEIFELKKSNSRYTRKTKPNRTERKGLVISRIGQGYYRDHVIAKWDARCAITGVSIIQVLIASHIKKWSLANDEERLDPENGILLSPNYDALFDKLLISFTSSGKMLVSNELSFKDLERLNINPTLILPVSTGMKKYLEFHRTQFTKRESFLLTN